MGANRTNGGVNKGTWGAGQLNKGANNIVLRCFYYREVGHKQSECKKMAAEKKALFIELDDYCDKDEIEFAG